MRVRSASTAALAALLAGACGAPENELESGRRYMSITYADTTLESFDRTDRAITGVLIERAGDSLRFRIRTKPDALVTGVDLTVHPASSRGERPMTTRVGMPERTLPLLGTSVAFLEQLVRRARVVGGDSVSIPVMHLGAHASLDVFTVIGNGSDSVLLVGPDGNLADALHVAVDGHGRILGAVLPLSGTKILSVEASP
jgi:hypothetical protein